MTKIGQDLEWERNAINMYDEARATWITEERKRAMENTVPLTHIAQLACDAIKNHNAIIKAKEDSMAEQTGGDTPGQYAVPRRAKTLNDLIEHKQMNFAIGNIFKAAYRIGDKENVTEEYDLEKIVYYAQRELKRLQRAKETTKV